MGTDPGHPGDHQELKKKTEYRDGCTPRESYGPGNGHQETTVPPGAYLKFLRKLIKNR
jgi:hypothetical protein